MQHRQDSTICDRVEELVAVPAGCKRTSLALTISDHGQSDEVWMIENGAKGMRDGIAQLATLVDATWRFGCAVTANAAWEGKLLEEDAHAFLCFCLLWVDLGVDSLEVRVGDD